MVAAGAESQRGGFRGDEGPEQPWTRRVIAAGALWTLAARALAHRCVSVDTFKSSRSFEFHGACTKDEPGSEGRDSIAIWFLSGPAEAPPPDFLE